MVNFIANLYNLSIIYWTYVLQHLEEVRKTLEACSVDKDIMEFVNLRKTGSEKPGKMEQNHVCFSSDFHLFLCKTCMPYKG